MATDAELFEAWCGGDRRAGDRLFQRHFATLYGFFRNTSVGAIDDLVQKTFLACVEGRDRIQQHVHFKAYMLACARHILYRALDEWNRKGKHIDFAVSSLHDVDPSPSQVLADKIEHRVLLEAMRRVSIDHQVVLQLYYLQGVRGPALLSILGIEEPAMRGRVRRGLDQLRTKIAELGQSSKMLEGSTEDLERWLESLGPIVCPPEPAPEDA